LLAKILFMNRESKRKPKITDPASHEKFRLGLVSDAGYLNEIVERHGWRLSLCLRVFVVNPARAIIPAFHIATGLETAEDIRLEARPAAHHWNSSSVVRSFTPGILSAR
jgi:hypothetical protein